METRTLRSTTRRLQEQAAAAGGSGTETAGSGEQAAGATLTPSSASASSKYKDLYKANPLPKTSKEVHEQRVSKDAQLRKERREALVASKRFKRSAAASDTPAETGTTEATEGDGEAEITLDQVNEVKALLKVSSAHHVGWEPYSRKQEDKVTALKRLSDYLSTDHSSGPVVAYATSAEFKDVLETDKITLGILAGTDAEQQLLATWVITNMAASSSALCEAAMTTTPHLIGFLDSQNVALVDQSAWALGNMAAEGPAFSERLRANGVLPPLIKLLDSKDLNLVQTACFALSNLARGQGTANEDLLKAGLVPPLLRHLRVDTEPVVISEAAWVIVYLTSGPENLITHLLEHRLIPLLVAPLKDFLTLGALAIPLVRALGNIASGPDDNSAELINEDGFLAALHQLIQSECRPVKKESLWLLSNLTADHQAGDVAKIVEAGFIPTLANIVTHQNYDIRKEAAYALVHLAAHGADYVQKLPHRELLPGFLDLLRTKDDELIWLGLRYAELILTTDIVLESDTAATTTTRQLFVEMNGVDALEAVILSDDRDQHRLASLLMDTCFGENNHGSRVPTPIPGTPIPEGHGGAGGGSDSLPPQYLKRASLSQHHPTSGLAKETLLTTEDPSL
ncbi:hypothetical protein BGZ73_000705 [Actinomortierella ambigua]|nr:hypothetical protein BGZ73_000705 [Actinomortierella ambigua]